MVYDEMISKRGYHDVVFTAFNPLHVGQFSSTSAGHIRFFKEVFSVVPDEGHGVIG